MAGCIRRRLEANALRRVECGLIKTMAETMDETKYLHRAVRIQANADSGFAFEMQTSGLWRIDGPRREGDYRRMRHWGNHGRRMSGGHLLLRRRDLHCNRTMVAGACTARNSIIQAPHGNDRSRTAVEVRALWRSIAQIDRLGRRTVTGV